jgi:hypothetical protein
LKVPAAPSFSEWLVIHVASRSIVSLASAGVRRSQPVQPVGLGRDLVDHPERGRLRRDAPEQGRLVTQRAQVGQAVTAVSKHHREIANHPARVMTATPPTQRPSPRESARDSPVFSATAPTAHSRMRRQTGSVRRHVYREFAAIALHLQGDPSELGSGPSTNRRIPAQAHTLPKNPG